MNWTLIYKMKLKACFKELESADLKRIQGSSGIKYELQPSYFHVGVATWSTVNKIATY